MPSSRVPRWNLSIIDAAVRFIIIFIAVLSIPLASAQTLGLTAAQTSSWILALYGLPAILSLVLTFYYRLPIPLTGNLFVIVFISRLGDQFSYPEIIGASILAGAVVLLVQLMGLTARLAALIPMPIVFGLLAGAVMPLVVNIFTLLEGATMLVGGTLLVYLASRRFLGNRMPAILPALVAGHVIALLGGDFGQIPTFSSLSVPTIISPDFSLPAIITATPVFVILITLQANMPSLIYLRSQEYQPPEAMINQVSGIATSLGSLFGPTGVSLSLPATSLVAGPQAGDHAIRHRSIYISAGVALLIGIMAGMAAEIPQMIPLSLLLSLAGLAVVDVLASALQQITQGPLVLGPMFAFAVALSEISLFGFGPFFWALIIGTGASLLLEREQLRTLRDRDQSNH